MYKIINLINNKIYIGQTINLHRRWTEHKSAARTNKINTPLYRAMRKYGIINFNMVELSCKIYNNYSDANLEEINLIKHYNSTHKNIGYNIDPGGNNHFVTEAQKQKLRMKRMGINNPFFGKKHTKKNISFFKQRMKKNKFRHGITSSADTLKKLSCAFSGNKNPNKKLNSEQVKEIRQLYNMGNITQQQLSIKYNVALITISRIIRNVNWKKED